MNFFTGIFTIVFAISIQKTNAQTIDFKNLDTNVQQIELLPGNKTYISNETKTKKTNKSKNKRHCVGFGVGSKLGKNNNFRSNCLNKKPPAHERFFPDTNKFSYSN